MRRISNIHCDNCNTLTGTKRLDKVKFKRFGQEFTAKDILAEVCPNCGERYFYGLEVTAMEKEIKKAILPKLV